VRYRDVRFYSVSVIGDRLRRRTGGGDAPGWQGVVAALTEELYYGTTV